MNAFFALECVFDELILVDATQCGKCMKKQTCKHTLNFNLVNKVHTYEVKYYNISIIHQLWDISFVWWLYTCFIKLKNKSMFFEWSSEILPRYVLWQTRHRYLAGTLNFRFGFIGVTDNCCCGPGSSLTSFCKVLVAGGAPDDVTTTLLYWYSSSSSWVGGLDIRPDLVLETANTLILKQ